MRQCRIASVCRLAHHPCCADCKDRTCDRRCWNSPERCGCWVESGPSQAKVRQTKVDRQKLLRLHKQGLLQKDIARRLGCSPSTVSAALRGMGVKQYG